MLLHIISVIFIIYIALVSLQYVSYFMSTHQYFHNPKASKRESEMSPHVILYDECNKLFIIH